VSPDELRCSGCGCAGTATDATAGWALSRPPRATGRHAPRTVDEERLTALCPACARRDLRLLEARLDP
jgi:hypothetical protein